MGDGRMMESLKSWAAVFFPIEGYRNAAFRNFRAKKRAKDAGRYFGEKLGAGARFRRNKNKSHFYTTYHLDPPERNDARTAVPPYDDH